MKACDNCKENLTERWQLKYCSNKCQSEAQYKKYIEQWKHGHKKILTKNISKHIKKYFLDTYGEKCSQCGWKEKNEKTGGVPLEIDHMDGNSNNNIENNLRLLCPNCHALTSNFKNLNRGSGRKFRSKN